MKEIGKENLGQNTTSKQKNNQNDLPWNHPRRWHRFYLRGKLQRLVESDLLPCGEKILDYGCGERPDEWMFKTKFQQYIGADLPGGKYADCTIGPENQLPVEDESIDCVLSTQVLEHVKNTRSYLKEAYRVLKPNGSLLLSTHGMWPYHPHPTDYWRWTLEGLELEISRAGFEIIQIQSIFSLASIGLQFWQDSTEGRVPSLFRPIYIGMIQFALGFIENKNLEKLSKNASVYILLAHKIPDLTQSENDERHLGR